MQVRADEKDADAVLNERAFPEFLEALYEFTVLKVRAAFSQRRTQRRV